MPLISVMYKFRIGIDRGKVSGIGISMGGDVGVLGEYGVDEVECDVGSLRLLRCFWSLYFILQYVV